MDCCITVQVALEWVSLFEPATHSKEKKALDKKPGLKLVLKEGIWSSEQKLMVNLPAGIDDM